jgi:hypothetical protein
VYKIDTTEKGSGREFFELVASSKNIAERYLSDKSARDKVIQWTFDYDLRVIKNGNSILFAEADKLDENLLPLQRINRISWSPIVSKASAQPSMNSNNQGNPIKEALANLQSDDPSSRRNARDALAGIGIASIEPGLQCGRTRTGRSTTAIT